MYSGLTSEPKRVLLARLFEDNELKALIQFHGTSQQHFYTVKRFEHGVGTEGEEQFPTLEAAKAAA